MLVDEQFGSDIPELAPKQGLSLTMPAEKSGVRTSSTSSTATTSAAHIEKYDLLATKVLVRYNPDGDAEMNERQTERLKELADWLHANDRKFLFELLVPAEDAQLESVGGDTDRYDAELRPELMRRVDRALPGRRRRGRHLEDRGRRHAARTRRCSPTRPARARAARTSRACSWAAAPVRRQGRPLAARGRAGRGLHRLRDRPLDLVGRAEGLPRRVAWTRDAAADQIADKYLRFIKVYDEAASSVSA